MHLKKIIISGFKSFADRVVITLDRGITGIIGPNGSGKSNVIDSVRWVMGEQNAKNLRGEKATDIIFAGSERRKPLGMAEVSLVFDNSEDDSFCPPEYRHESEITLTRRIYSDGQREYLINRRPCRFKDIIGFFAMTGLGGRSYSIIQQGQVERIVTAKPEDMREIIEEAAGTMLYKRRKEEAQKKLEQTRLNLSRIDDIFNEVEKALGSLEGQVAKAREWQELSDKLREDEVALFAHNFAYFSEQRAKLVAASESETAQEAKHLADLSALEARHAELQSMLDDSDPEIQALNEAISVVREKIARSESMLKSATQRLQSGTRRLEALAFELAEDDTNLKTLEGQADEARQKLAAADSKARDLSEAIESFEVDYEEAGEAAQVYQSRIDDLEDEVRNVERLLEQNHYHTANNKREVERAQAVAADERLRLLALEPELESVQDDLAAAEEKAGEVKGGLDQEIKEKHAREAAVARRYTQIKEASQRRESLRERYHALKARVASLEEIQAGATDVASEVARLRAEAPDAVGLMRGLVADFVAFEDAASQLPQRVRSALERWTERLIVDGLAPFNQLVRVANQLGLGAIPALIVDRLAACDEAQARQWAELCGAEPLAQYVRLNGEAGPWLERLIARAYFLPALQISDVDLASLPAGLVVFTAQGVCFTGGEEFVVGGKTATGLLSRKRELETIAAEFKIVEADLGRTQAEIDEHEFSINRDRQVIAEIDQRLQRQNQDVVAIMSALTEARQLFERKSEQIDAAREALGRAEQAAERLHGEAQKLGEAHAALTTELEGVKGELCGLEDEAQALIERREEMRRIHDGRKLELATSQARAQTLRESFVTTKAQLELLQNKLSRRYEERSRLEQDLEAARREEAQSTLDAELFVAERETLERDFASKREANAGTLEEIRVLDGRLKQLRDALASLRKATGDRDVQLERLRMAIEGVTTQAQEKYHVALDSHAFERDPEFNNDARTRSVARLRAKIEAMGAINMMALSEYEEKTARRDFIARQRDEVVSSMDLLAAVIAEIEDTSLRKFLEAFHRINEEFAQLFPILFPTGEGRLELTSKDNPVEGGVEIMCRLPGKAIQPMSVRSGGEKALIAISLIFALLRTKPTPFCFLDEVDAPLDEANVGRYNAVLQALSSQFQFVVITHNRRTMEVLDTLYGVTMQEPGVSKVVGVDMQRDLPPHLRKSFKEEGGTGKDAAAAKDLRPVPRPGASRPREIAPTDV